MTDKNHLLSFLRMQGLSLASNDEEIRSVLLSARFNEEEILNAIAVLRGVEIITNTSRLDSLHAVFRTEGALKPSEVSDLLGIDVKVVDITTHRGSSQGATVGQSLIILFLALSFAFLALVAYMYVEKIGFFHPIHTKLAN